MAEPHIAVEPRPGGRWASRRTAKRALRVVDNKAEAELIARAQATREGAELVVKGADGRSQRRNSHGADSPRRPG